MYAVSFAVCKRQHHQFCSRLFIQGTFRIKKLYFNKTSVENPQKKKKWWRVGFQNIFGKYLLLTNTISSGFLMAVGDLIQQQVEYIESGKHKNSFDWHRNRNMGIVGTLQGPFTHFFYQILDKYFPGIKMTSIAKKIFLDQTIASPLCIVLFFLGMNYLNNVDFETSKNELKNKFWIVYAADCSIWIPIQFFNFYCLSTQYRVIYVNLVTMCYNVFLSYIKHSHNSN